MILLFQMKEDVISEHFLMVYFQKDSLETVGFRTYRGGPRVLNKQAQKLVQVDVLEILCNTL